MPYAFNATFVLTHLSLEYGTQPFRVATFRHWQYIVSTPKYIDELSKASDEVVSFKESVVEVSRIITVLSLINLGSLTTHYRF